MPASFNAFLCLDLFIYFTSGGKMCAPYTFLMVSCISINPLCKQGGVAGSAS